MTKTALSDQAKFQAAVRNQNAGRLEAAAHLYEETLSLNPQHVGALFNLAALAAGRSDFEQSIAIYGRVLAIVPDDPDTLCNMGHVRQIQGRLDEAADFYSRAIERNPLLTAAHVNVGNVFVNTGRLAEAEASFRTALQQDPGQAQAHSNLGVVLWQQKRTDEALAAFEMAARLAPDDPEVQANLANVLFELGRHEEAASCFSKAASLKPDWPQVFFNLAVLESKMDRAAEAEKHFREALALKPDYMEAIVGLAELLRAKGDEEEENRLVELALSQDIKDAAMAFHLGNLFHGRMDWERAADNYAIALELESQSPEIYNNFGSTLHSAGHYEKSKEILQKGLEVAPDNSLLWNSFGNALGAIGDHDQAISAYQRALELDPGFEMAASNLGNSLREAQRFEEGYSVFAELLERMPESTHLLNSYGLLFNAQSRNREALPFFEQALQINPHYFEARNNLAMCHQGLGDYHKALALYRDILAEKPDFPEVLFNLGNILQVMGRYDESVVAFKQALAIRPGYRQCYSYLAHGLMYTCNWTNLDAVIDQMLSMAREDLAGGKPLSLSGFELLSTPAPMDLRCDVAKNAAARAAESVAGIASQIHFDYRRPENGKLKIGYVSPDFRFHSVAVAFRGILDHHDRNEFEYYGYALAPTGKDSLTEHFSQTFDHFRDISQMPLADAAKQINDDGINILIDLAGPTRFSKPAILALRPAPIQAHYLGYSSTVGGDYIQYLITDHQQVAPGMEEHFAEQLVYLPETFMATTKSGIDERPVERAGWNLPENGFVFANFNSHYKFDPRMFSIWMRLLKRIPGSVLWLIKGTPTSQNNLKREAETRGVSPNRLIFAETVIHSQHLARQKLVDLSLDNQYHGGGVTTVDSLWVGTPVLTVAGASPPSRNGATLLHAIGMDELITYSLDEYEAKAYDLATSPNELSRIRETLLTNKDTEPLFDTERLTRHLETAYYLMWENYESGNSPRSIEVPPLPRKPAQ